MSDDDRAKWQAWTGADVEGRLAGIPTLFLAAPTIAVDHVRHITVVKAWCGHILWGTSYLKRFGWDLLQQQLHEGHQYHTVEVTPELLDEAPDEVAQQCHIMLRLPAPSCWWRLKPTDTVRFDFDHLSVACVGVRHFDRHWPEEYEHDRPTG